MRYGTFPWRTNTGLQAAIKTYRQQNPQPGGLIGQPPPRWSQLWQVAVGLASEFLHPRGADALADLMRLRREPVGVVDGKYLGQRRVMRIGIVIGQSRRLIYHVVRAVPERVERGH